MPVVHLLDYVAGNVRSLVNAVEKIGYTIEWVRTPEDVEKAHFAEGRYLNPIQKHIEAGKPFLGICVGLQALFAGSEESPATPGLSIIPQQLSRFNDINKSVPHIGWNSAVLVRTGQNVDQSFFGLQDHSKYYYVHSYAVPYEPGYLEAEGWTVATAKYGDEEFIGAIGRRNLLATQFHPEKSGTPGLRLLKAFLDGREWDSSLPRTLHNSGQGLTRRVIACLDVRTNDDGDLVVTKGDQYDVRAKAGTAAQGLVRNLGKPVDMAQKYYDQGADEITFLNITSFRNCPLADLPMLEILRRTAETVFVPLTIGGGIRETVDATGSKISALQVATIYFKSGADKVSIGSDAVLAAMEYYRNDKRLSGRTAIETISAAYGIQAVVVSVDPKRVYVRSGSDTVHRVIKPSQTGPSGEEYCWYQCTMKGGRESTDLDVQQLVEAVEAMGAGEILLNCIDKDGSNSGFDLELIREVKRCTKVPVIASSGAGKPAHFTEVFQQTSSDAALGAGMFHRGEYTVKDVKDHLLKEGLLIRQVERPL
ncbi:MAG: hypothetical protein LQ350_008226 [Teloschistes chrysophthalmus]|nr:MAG: hypothetical protein LQ350_008226 [Niorma chrysophthalma]